MQALVMENETITKDIFSSLILEFSFKSTCPGWALLGTLKELKNIEKKRKNCDLRFFEAPHALKLRRSAS